jgi:2-polyprenyl-3-methyl-5-hydroxy-6-metoxy-1,4-benzoquinol methylase
MRLENVACNLCGGEDALQLFSSRERRFGLGGWFNVVQCQDCGLVYLNPRPTAREMRRYYPAEQYFPYRKVVRQHGFVQSIRLGLKRVVLAEHKGYPRRRDLLGHPLPGARLVTGLLRGRFRGLPEYVRGGKLLDVGCGSGNYLYSLSELGWDVYGVEVDAGAAGYARDQLGLSVVSGTLEEADFPDTFFHVVTMRQVLEHLPDPSDTLAEVHRVLKPGGRLMVEVPNIASLTAALFKSWWFNLDVPRHLYSFTPQTLEAMLKRGGFGQVEIEHIADTSGITGSLQYLWNARTKDPEGNAIRRSKALHLALWPMAFLLARLGRGEMVRAWGCKGEGSGFGG